MGVTRISQPADDELPAYTRRDEAPPYKIDDEMNALNLSLGPDAGSDPLPASRPADPPGTNDDTLFPIHLTPRPPPAAMIRPE